MLNVLFRNSKVHNLNNWTLNYRSVTIYVPHPVYISNAYVLPAEAL